MALSLPKPIPKSLSAPSLTHLFSSSSSIPPSPPPQPNDSQQQNHQSNFSSRSSLFEDVKSKLRQKNKENPSPNSSPFRNPASNYPSFSRPTNRTASLENIGKNLAEFRRRSAVPIPNELRGSEQANQQQVSFQELYRKDQMKKNGDESGNVSSGIDNSNSKAVRPMLDVIRQNLKNLSMKQSAMGGSGGIGNERREEGFPSSPFRNSLNLGPYSADNHAMRSNVIGGTQGLPMGIFGKDANKDGGSGNLKWSNVFLSGYTHESLGKKLKELRPQVKAREKNWFSLRELNERLKKVRQKDDEAESKIAGVPNRELRISLMQLARSDEKAKKSSALGWTPTSLLGLQEPPKEHLVEKYFHPDNMSSAEKLKIELAKVREEFKMSESDCGSARVQVAQLTTKIKHLSNVLHKKDKHSRKGLLAMVQQRKKLLKYLRRTDWDSYCLVLSKLGLRDNPDYKY